MKLSPDRVVAFFIIMKELENQNIKYKLLLHKNYLEWIYILIVCVDVNVKKRKEN